MKRPALQNKQVVVVRMAFQAQKVLGTFEKRAPALFEQCVGSFTSRRIMNNEELRDGAYGLSSLYEKTRKSNHVQL